MVLCHNVKVLNSFVYSVPTHILFALPGQFSWLKCALHFPPPVIAVKFMSAWRWKRALWFLTRLSWAFVKCRYSKCWILYTAYLIDINYVNWSITNTNQVMRHYRFASFILKVTFEIYCSCNSGFPGGKRAMSNSAPAFWKSIRISGRHGRRFAPKRFRRRRV